MHQELCLLNKFPPFFFLISLLLFGYICPLFSSANQQSAAILIDEHTEKYSLGLAASYLEDKENNLSIHDVIGKKFHPSQSTILGFGFTQSTYWIKVTFNPHLTEKQTFYLEIDYPLLDHLDFYYPDANATYKKISTGDIYPFDNRQIHHRNFVFPIKFIPGIPQTIYLSCKTSSSMNLPLTLLSSSALANEISKEQIILGLYYGILLTMIIFSIFIYLTLWDMVYVHYALFIFFYMLFQLSLNGLSFQYLWPNSIWWANNSITFFICFAFLFATLFTRNVLNTPKISLRMDRLLLAIVGISALGLFLPFFTSYQVSVKYATALNLITPMLILAGIVSLIKGYRPALYYCIAWTAFLAGVAFFALKTFGFVPNNVFTRWSMQIGSAWEVLILFMGLAHRFKIMETEKNTLQENYARDLESRVTERTKELEKSKEELQKAKAEAERANRAKSQFLANMSHELRTPMHAILSFSSMGLEKYETAPKNKLERYFSRIHQSGNRLLNLLNDLLDLSKLEAGKMTFSMAKCDIRQLVATAFDEFSMFAQEHSVQLRKIAPEVDTVIYCDSDKILQVLRNLLSNAIKFTPEGKSVTLSYESGTLPCGRRESDTVIVPALVIKVEDEGIGIQEKELELVFDKFVQSAKTRSSDGGTGLGLAICKEIVDNHRGGIYMHQNIADGATVVLTLPYNEPKCV